MLTGWFLVPYIIDPDPNISLTRVCALHSEGLSSYDCWECLGDQSVAKVVAPEEVLDTLRGKFTFICYGIDEVFNEQRRVELKNISLSAGYTEAQINEKSPNVLTYKDWINAMLTYRQRPTLVDGVIVLSGPTVPSGSGEV